MDDHAIRIFPPERINLEYPWAAWALGWLAFFRAFLWLAWEPVQSEAVLRLLAYKFTLGMLPLVVFAVGVWNLRKWAVWGLMIIAAADLVFFLVYSQTLKAVVVDSEVYIYTMILSVVTLFCNGPLGDLFILGVAPGLLKQARNG
jgi:hypothetical protein